MCLNNWISLSNELDRCVQMIGLTCPTYLYNKLHRHPLVDIQTNIVFTS